MLVADFSAFHLLPNEWGGRGIGLCYLGRSPGDYYIAAVLASARPHVDYMVGCTYHVKVVFDYQHGVPLVYEAVEHS